jgi:nucleoside-diphosphate-sugar epimerase
MVIEISEKSLGVQNVPGPQGVRGRNSDNRLIREKLDWEPQQSLHDGISKTYRWISEQLQRRHNKS